MTEVTLIEEMRKTSKFDLAVKMFFLVFFIVLLSIILCIGPDTVFQSVITVLGIAFAVYSVSEQMDQLSRENKRKALVVYSRVCKFPLAVGG